ncbi:hypothetical protein F1559_003630 [Cyanidiococcus yangmingshanensis]|uniref:Uncharacterized protein n=1 Tax=Cyanidiococcus yangmingshanensis TaxID=2690220 RepID=A0A7J7II64_9RHOD|nr:hypothetical protein F1559_003630 [Cyanidiococcus yangmingshanensis]
MKMLFATTLDITSSDSTITAKIRISLRSVIHSWPQVSPDASMSAFSDLGLRRILEQPDARIPFAPSRTVPARHDRNRNSLPETRCLAPGPTTKDSIRDVHTHRSATCATMKRIARTQ